jgi:S-adenosylmethionine:tRNA ribosyltransferase-isomerase
MKLRDFDYLLPRNLIAQHPAPQRAQSRLMVLDRETRIWEHGSFSNLPRYLQPGDVLVLNETKVLPARLIGEKRTGGKVEILLVRERRGQEDAAEKSLQEANRTRKDGSGEWECLVKNSGKIRPGTLISFDQGVRGMLLGRSASGLWRLGLECEGDLGEKLRGIGFPPLPPYIQRNGNGRARTEDLERYQTVYARCEGSIAAPTAGLHFSEALLDEIKERGIRVCLLTLHVGLGTFLPVKQEEVEKHRLEPEFFEVPPETAGIINQTHAAGQKVIAAGTTVTRALESCLNEQGTLTAKKGTTDLFILPGFPFRAVDALITNFHLPRSTLLMLVSAFAGKELIRAAYEEAIRKEYRFYSYGDAMLIL